MGSSQFYRAISLFFGLFLVSCWGCAAPSEDERVVAWVNGEAIHFFQLEAKHDLKYLARTAQFPASMSRLKEEYGDVLAEIVVQVLVAQFLAQQGMTVSPDELLAAEALVRADYPEGVFDQILIEEYIDLDMWREQLKATLDLELFFQKVLRPDISVDSNEVDDYYRENITDFYLRPSVRFLLVQGQDREMVKKILELTSSESDPQVLSKRFDKVDVHVYTLREDSIPEDWQTLLASLEPLQATDILMRDPEGFQALVLLDRTMGKMIEPAQAYPLVERILVERKLREAFDSWLEKTVQEAHVEVDVQLLRQNE